jgi:16S rRNA (adenine1518-N6/adenine1519-N6)-dimethyltransferase
LADFAGSPSLAEELLIRAGVNPTLRGEALGINEFVAIARAIV